MKTSSFFETCCLMAVSATLLLSLIAYATHPKQPAHGKTPLYVFLFIGDGMASAQLHAAESYLAATKEKDTTVGTTTDRLTMTTFPVVGMQKSVANNRHITGSAAAGTALACGEKTNIGVIAMNPEATKPYTSLAEAAKARGMKVGIVSSVSLDHATPAAFYAHTKNRSNFEEIGEFMLESDFDYFAGGGFRVDTYKSSAHATVSVKERYARLESRAKANGFAFSNTRAEFDALNERHGRVIAINPVLDDYNAMPFALNRNPKSIGRNEYRGSITLAEFTQKGIDLLQDAENGFFMMIEGGKIDWACHANDARTAIEETIAFDRAVGVAVEFAKKRPEQTLIVVTGDHECGGLALGYAGTGYETEFEKLEAQTVAYDDFGSKILTAYKESHNPLPDHIDKDMWQIIFERYGMDGNELTTTAQDDLTKFEAGLLEAAFDETMGRTNGNSDQENRLLYGRNEPLTVTLTHLLNRKSGISWTSFFHTAVPVPVFATGYQSEWFDGYYDNTDVAKKIANAMQVSIGEVPEQERSM